MKKTQLLSVVFSLIMFTGLTAGTAVAYAESDDDENDFEDRLEHYCEMSNPEKEQLFYDHPKLKEFEVRLNEFCDLDEDEREDLIEQFIAENFPNFKEQDDWDLDDILDRYCNLAENEKDSFLEKYPMASEHKDRIEEYCLLDESEREAFIEEHEDEYEKHDYDMEDILEKYCEMTEEEKITFLAEQDKSEDHKAKMDEYCTLDESEREAFIEEHEGEYEKEHDYKKHDSDMREKMDEFCEMSDEEKRAHIEYHDKTEEYLAKINEYCSLDDEGRDAFILEYKDSMKDEISEHKDSMKDEISEHKDSMKDEISEHKDSMKSERKYHVLKASSLTDEQKDDIKSMHTALRDMKHTLRDKTVDDSEKQEIRDQFMEMAKEFSMTWLSPRHQVSAGIDAQMVECREGFELVMKTSNASPMCVKETTADKLVKRGIAILAT